MATHANNRWGHIWIEPWWTSGFKNLAYINEPFNDPESEKHWRDLGFTQTRFTGDMYDMRYSEPGWINGFRYHFPWQHFSWSVYRMAPGTVIPNHRDIYSRFKNIYGITDSDSIWRAVVMLEDWQSGHYLEIDGRPIVNWIAGDVFIWQNDVPHLAANMGMTDRFTLQLTGVPNENPLL